MSPQKNQQLSLQRKANSHSREWAPAASLVLKARPVVLLLEHLADLWNWSMARAAFSQPVDRKAAATYRAASPAPPWRRATERCKWREKRAKVQQLALSVRCAIFQTDEMSKRSSGQSNLPSCPRHRRPRSFRVIEVASCLTLAR